VGNRSLPAARYCPGICLEEERGFLIISDIRTKDCENMGPHPTGFMRQQKCEQLKRIFVPRRVEITGVWRKLYNEELENCTFHQMLLE
jgi:hypothetical protein